MKVFTDTDSQFFARVFQPTASSLKMEPTQTVAASLKMEPVQTNHNSLFVTARNTANHTLLRTQSYQSVAASLKMEPVQTNHNSLFVTARNTANHTLLRAQVYQSVASNLQVAFSQTAASALQMTLADRETLDSSAAVSVTSSTTFNYGAVQTVITLSKFAFLVKGGTASANVKIQLSPIGGTVAANWVDDDTITRDLAISTVTILTPTRFAKYMRVGGEQSGTLSASLTVYYQGHV